MKENKLSRLQFFWRITACHMATYFIMGLLAMSLLNYKGFFAKDILAGISKNQIMIEINLKL